MTVEKAIEILSGFGIINRYCSEDAEALDMAIKALEQQPCEDCTVIKKLSKKYYVEDAYGYTDEDIVNKVNEIIDVVNEIIVINDVLDKIRAEIEALTDGAKPERIWNVDVLAIIDKYKAESEDKK